MEPDDASEPRYAFELTGRDRDQWYRLACAVGFPRRERKRRRWAGTPPQHAPRHEPTPEEIADACRVIQEGWSDSEELSRRAGSLRRVAWVVPEGC